MTISVTSSHDHIYCHYFNLYSAIWPVGQWHFKVDNKGKVSVTNHTTDSAANEIVNFLFGPNISTNETTISGVLIYEGIAHRLQHWLHEASCHLTAESLTTGTSRFTKQTIHEWTNRCARIHTRIKNLHRPRRWQFGVTGLEQRQG
jgi:hypothetical protein